MCDDSSFTWTYENQQEWACVYPLWNSQQTSPITVFSNYTTPNSAVAEYLLTYFPNPQPTSFVQREFTVKFFPLEIMNYLLLNGRHVAKLVNVHFHLPNEHAIFPQPSEEKDYVMEIHMVHELSFPIPFYQRETNNNPENQMKFCGIGIFIVLGERTSPELLPFFSVIANTENPPPQTVLLDFSLLAKWTETNHNFYTLVVHSQHHV